MLHEKPSNLTRGAAVAPISLANLAVADELARELAESSLFGDPEDEGHSGYLAVAEAYFGIS